MTFAAAVRRLLGTALAVVCLLTVVSVSAQSPAPAEPHLAPAADLSRFDPGNIITDAVFTDSGSMTAAQIQSFLDYKGDDCAPTNGAACLKDYVQTTPTRAADQYCDRYQGATESAAAIIKKVAVACRISPRVLMVTLQKEMGFLTSEGPTPKMYTRAMGYGCPDNTGGVCDSLYNGFFNQLYSASKQFRRYASNPTRYGHVPGTWNYVRYHPNSACGSGRVFIENQATASLYNYTPYQPNSASLAAGYAGSTNTCASYGNRNFYNYFTDWFGSTQSGGRDVDAPVGRLEAVADRGDSVLVRGWAYDPNSPTAPVQVNVYAGGTKIGTVTTDRPRPDVAEANYGTGNEQGFETILPLSVGTHTVCAYPVNIGAGYSNPRLGCAKLAITPVSARNPKGKVADVRVAATRVVVEGWSFDPDALKSATTVRVYAGSLRLGDLVADKTWADVGKFYPSAGSAHGFRLSTRLTAGTHKVCVYAINIGGGTGNPLLGCRTVKVTAPPLVAPITTGDPLGRVATVELEGQDVRLTGWSFDPDAAAKPATVQVFAGPKIVAQTVANGDWPDVARYFPYAGSAHAFTLRGILPHGSYDLCVHAVDEGAGNDSIIGCRAVAVVGDPKANPIGGPRVVEVEEGSVRVAGWAFDPDVPTAPIAVRIYAGTTKLADVVAGGDWPDVGKHYPTAGNAHGFEWSGPVPAGEQKICVYAFNIRYGTGNPQLGCESVTVSGMDTGEREEVDPTQSGQPEPTTTAPESSADAEPSATAEPTGTAQPSATADPTATP